MKDGRLLSTNSSSPRSLDYSDKAKLQEYINQNKKP